MRILKINKYYHVVGGTDKYFLEISRLLKRNNHPVAVFSMEHEKNKLSSWSKFFVSKVSFNSKNYVDRLRFFGRILYSTEARKKISILLSKFNPDIAHIHSVYHNISPSILQELKNRNISIFMTVHDYHLISPNYNLFHKGKICEISKPNKYYKAIFHRCIKNSYFYSMIEVLEKYVHDFLGWEKNYIDFFIAPSLFMKNKLVEYKIPEEKIIHIPHFIDVRSYSNKMKKGDYILYFGRLSPEKGLPVLIEAMRRLPKINLIIVGTGKPDYVNELQSQTKDCNNIKFTGYKQGKALKDLIANARFSVLPSVWYEVFGLSILESFASGRPVVASNIGGIPEIVIDGYNGLLFEPKNVNDCREKISKLWKNSSLCVKMGKNARNFTIHKFSPQKHYRKLLGVYKKALNQN